MLKMVVISNILAFLFIITFDYLIRTYKTYGDLEADYVSLLLHPGDLKPAIVKTINHILKPIRDHFNNDPHAKELLALIKSYRVLIRVMPDFFINDIR